MSDILTEIDTNEFLTILDAGAAGRFIPHTKQAVFSKLPYYRARTLIHEFGHNFFRNEGLNDFFAEFLCMGNTSKSGALLRADYDEQRGIFGAMYGKAGGSRFWAAAFDKGGSEIERFLPLFGNGQAISNITPENFACVMKTIEEYCDGRKTIDDKWLEFFGVNLFKLCDEFILTIKTGREPSTQEQANIYAQGRWLHMDVDLNYAPSDQEQRNRQLANSTEHPFAHGTTQPRSKSLNNLR